MNRRHGQSLVELAICLPVLVVLTLGGAAVARVADARSGLDAATQAALAAAARSRDEASARSAGAQEFALAIAGYPVTGSALTLTAPGFDRGTTWVGRSTAWVDISFVPIPGLPRAIRVEASGAATIETWRSR